MYLIHAANAAARALVAAVQRRSRAGKVELLFERPALLKRVDKSGVEDVPCASGVDHFDAVRRLQIELVSIPRQHTILPERCGREPAVIVLVNRAQRLLQVALAGEAAGKSRLTIR